MAKTKRKKHKGPVEELAILDVEVLLDEQGGPWPPPLALAAHVTNYGGVPDSQLQDRLVQVGAYHPDAYVFEAWLTERTEQFSIDEAIFLMREELLPVNDFTRKYMDGVVTVATPVYADEIYDLRDRLDAVGIHATAESIASWSVREQEKVSFALKFLDAEDTGKREELIRKIKELKP